MSLYQEVLDYVCGDKEYKGWNCWEVGDGKLIFRKGNNEFSIYISPDRCRNWVDEAWKQMKARIDNLDILSII